MHAGAVVGGGPAGGGGTVLEAVGLTATTARVAVRVGVLAMTSGVTVGSGVIVAGSGVVVTGTKTINGVWVATRVAVLGGFELHADKIPAPIPSETRKIELVNLTLSP